MCNECNYWKEKWRVINEHDKLEEEKEMLISDLMKLQNELNVYKYGKKE